MKFYTLIWAQIIVPVPASFLCMTALCLFLHSCAKNSGASDSIPGEKTLTATDPLLDLLSSEETGIDFQNTILESFELNITTHPNTSNGGGVAVFDANNDGLQDIYFVSTSTENKLYVNQGNMKFKDDTSRSGLASAEGFECAVTAADVNADGFMDIYICRGGPQVNEARRNLLFINNGDLTFSEKAKAYGLDDISASMGAAFFDYDLDGDLDLYLLNYPVDFQYSSKINVRPNADSTGVEPILNPIEPYDSDRFYRNDGPLMEDGSGGFKDVSKEAGIWNFGYGLSVSIEDFNQDGWPDVFVANDFIQPDLLYINNKNGTFTNKLREYFLHTSQHTMGVDLADFTNDGLFDLLAVDMMNHTQYRKKTLVSSNSQNKYNTLIRYGYFEPVVRNVLQQNNGDGTFSDVACLANVYNTDWSWSALLHDMDNDGWKDILITNGYVREVMDNDFINYIFPSIREKGSLEGQFNRVEDFLATIPRYKVRDFIFRNNGDLTFEDMSGKWMTMPATWSNGAVAADLDNDGDLDYVVNNIDDPAFVYKNMANEKTNHHYLQVTCKGPDTNPFGVGTSIRLFSGQQKQYAMMSPNRGIFSSAAHVIHFGLGTSATIDRLEIRWPDGKVQVLERIAPDQQIEVAYTNANVPAHSSAVPPIPMFTNVTKSSGFLFRHIENDYVDFEFAFLMPWSLSDLGPLMDTADVNLDGYMDVYIGNSFSHPGGLFIQSADGKFTPAYIKQWATDSIYEDHGALFFDADLDGDKDLFTISGGYESTTKEAWQSRLYINERERGFIHARGAIPLLKDICLRAVAHDYDGDQDLDLFLGGRIVSGRYPEIPDSYILRNDRNKFTEVTKDVAPDFSKSGMVTDLQFANLDEDNALELVVVGEWMQISIFNNNNGKFSKVNPKKTGLDDSQGFWNRIEIVDIDRDGDQDLITGNLGLNSPYRASASHPIECYVGDYDMNGSIDPIITYYEGDICYPMVQKDVLIKQIPSMKKKYIFAKDYAVATIRDVLTSRQIKESMILKSKILESGWWENRDGKFIFHTFPSQAQVSPVQAILVHDFDYDGKLDILLAGNKYRMEVETGRMDAGTGTLLKALGDGKFTWINNLSTGIWAHKDVRDLALLKNPEGKKHIIVANNNSAVQVYREN